MVRKLVKPAFCFLMVLILFVAVIGSAESNEGNAVQNAQKAAQEATVQAQLAVQAANDAKSAANEAIQAASNLRSSVDSLNEILVLLLESRTHTEVQQNQPCEQIQEGNEEQEQYAVVRVTGVRASQESRKAIILTSDNKLKTMMIMKPTLDRYKEGVDYEVIRVTVKDGYYLLVNKSGVVGEVLTREDKAYQEQKAGIRPEEIVKLFFNDDGYLLWTTQHNHVIEGWARENSEIGLYEDVENVFIVHFYNESFNRIVILPEGTSQESSHELSDTQTEQPTGQPTDASIPTVSLAPTPKPTPKPIVTLAPRPVVTKAPDDEQDDPDNRETWKDETDHNEQPTPTKAPAEEQDNPDERETWNDVGPAHNEQDNSGSHGGQSSHSEASSAHNDQGSSGGNECVTLAAAPVQQSETHVDVEHESVALAPAPEPAPAPAPAPEPVPAPPAEPEPPVVTLAEVTESSETPAETQTEHSDQGGSEGSNVQEEVADVHDDSEREEW